MTPAEIETEAARLVPLLSPDARIILECAVALKGITGSKGVQTRVYAELTDVDCLTADGDGGYSPTPLGERTAQIISERARHIRTASRDRTHD